MRNLIFKNIIEIFAGTCLCVMCICVIISVFDRFVMQMGLPWPEEVARYLLVWGAFLSMAAVAKKNQHYAVDFFTKKWFSDETMPFVHIAVNVLSCIVMVIAIAKGIEITIIMNGQQSPALGIPMSWIFASIPICCCLIFLFFFYYTTAEIKYIYSKKTK